MCSENERTDAASMMDQSPRNSTRPTTPTPCEQCCFANATLRKHPRTSQGQIHPVSSFTASKYLVQCKIRGVSTIKRLACKRQNIKTKQNIFIRCFYTRAASDVFCGKRKPLRRYPNVHEAPGSGLRRICRWKRTFKKRASDVLGGGVITSEPATIAATCITTIISTKRWPWRKIVSWSGFSFGGLPGVQIRWLFVPADARFKNFKKIDQVPVGHISRSVTVVCHGDRPEGHVVIRGIFLPIQRSSFKVMVSEMLRDFPEGLRIVCRNNSEEGETSNKLISDVLVKLAKLTFTRELPEIYGNLDMKALLLLLVGGVDRSPNEIKIRGNNNIPDVMVCRFLPLPIRRTAVKTHVAQSSRTSHCASAKCWSSSRRNCSRIFSTRTSNCAARHAVSTALAWLHLADEVDKDVVQEALRLLEMSKDSLNQTEQNSTHVQNKAEKIFALVRELTRVSTTARRSSSDVMERYMTKGYKPDQVDACIEEYEELIVWQVNQKRTRKKTVI
ncbi:DNA replication licensing factor MCM7 [Culex quinquefasciatus]|uniref:DNA replication licensing factor MCM7 n=1 Tax=Culex quinquefasciatus TaxID=7176 RepID=B0WYM9_CULQU|nr:DNA replication licensing factor MCM7 [Culex quinquefasciatus]|eukprot:XP_001862501.1 DNA replication licensing factor MCM7 [Culex quinquefasciatus]